MATMNSSERIPVTISTPNTAGVETDVQDMVWASSDETVVTTEMDSTGKSGFLNAVAAGPNAARVVMTCDADLGAGVVTLTFTTEDITVTQDPATQAQSIVVTLGAPVPKA